MSALGAGIFLAKDTPLGEQIAAKSRSALRQGMELAQAGRKIYRNFSPTDEMRLERFNRITSKYGLDPKVDLDFRLAKEILLVSEKFGADPEIILQIALSDSKIPGVLPTASLVVKQQQK